MSKITLEGVKAQFEKDIKNHSMEVIMDNGLYRHLKFTKDGSQCYRFDIHTWPGYLCICQDMGTYVFSRITDMFEFFIMDERDFNHRHIINPRYWAEKLQAVDKDSGRDSNGYEEFSTELFEEAVMNEYNQFIEGNEIDPKSDYAEKLKEAIENEVLGAVYGGEYPAFDAAMSFSFKNDNWSLDEKYDYPEFSLAEFYEHNCRDYTFHYLWICFAIVWGIQEYNKSKKAQ